MLYDTCCMISSVDLAHYGYLGLKVWISAVCATIKMIKHSAFIFFLVTGCTRIFSSGIFYKERQLL